MIKLCKGDSDLDPDPTVPNPELIQDIFIYCNMINFMFLTMCQNLVIRPTVCTVVNGENLETPTMTLILITQCLMSNSFELLSNKRLKFNVPTFKLFRVIVLTHTQTYRRTKNSSEYLIVAFFKNATIIISSVHLKMESVC